METKDKSSYYYLLKVLHYAFVEIREEAYQIKNNRIYGLSNLLHNLPMELNSIDANDFDESSSILLQKLLKKAEKHGASEWIDNIIASPPSGE